MLFTILNIDHKNIQVDNIQTNLQYFIINIEYASSINNFEKLNLLSCFYYLDISTNLLAKWWFLRVEFIYICLFNKWSIHIATISRNMIFFFVVNDSRNCGLSRDWRLCIAYAESTMSDVTKQFYFSD